MPFLRSLPPYGPARDAVLLGAIHTGNLDTPTWVKLTLGRVELEVSSDYLTIAGEHVPMAAYVAQAAVDSLDGILPTTAIVDAIEREVVVLVPLPTWAPPAGQDRSHQLDSDVLALCEDRTQAAFIRWRIRPGQLVAGHRKDVVLARYMPAGTVVIYGAKWPDGRRLQPLHPTGPGGTVPPHEAAYQDYSHGCRCIRNACLLDGKPTTVRAILEDPVLAPLLGGQVAMTRYPAAPSSTAISTPGTSSTPPPASLPMGKGARGEAVKEVQRLLCKAGFTVAVDGIFGPLTEAGVRSYQGEYGLVQTGVVNEKTLASLGGATPPESVPTTMPDLTRVPLPLNDAERIQVFGSFEWAPAPRADEPGAIRIFGNWVKDNITTILVPQLVGVRGTPSGRITCHRLAAPSILRFFAAVEAAGKLSLILSFDGCWNPRMVRGGSSLSNHAFGTDFDLNAAWNPRGKEGPPVGVKGSVVELVPIMMESGLGWGGNWSTPDWMHAGARTAE